MTNDDSDAHQLIADAIKTHSDKIGRPIDYIEVGVLTGNSAIAALGTGCVRHATLIDNFSYPTPPSSKAFVEKRLEQFNGSFQVIEGDSKQILSSIPAGFDVGFVDGDHTAEGCRIDMTKMLPLLRDDGVMFIHDLTNPGFTYLKRVVEKFAQRNNLEMKFHDHVHNALGELRRK